MKTTCSNLNDVCPFIGLHMSAHPSQGSTHLGRHFQCLALLLQGDSQLERTACIPWLSSLLLSNLLLTLPIGGNPGPPTSAWRTCTDPWCVAGHKHLSHWRKSLGFLQVIHPGDSSGHSCKRAPPVEASHPPHHTPQAANSPAHGSSSWGSPASHPGYVSHHHSIPPSVWQRWTAASCAMPWWPVGLPQLPWLLEVQELTKLEG